MSEVTGDHRRQRRRRSDAERSIAAILDAAVRVLNERPEASVGDVAQAAGVTRPTVYAHFPSREALLSAAIDRVTEESLAEMDAVDQTRGSPVEALRLLMKAGWQTLERYPLLLGAAAALQWDSTTERARHDSVRLRLQRVIERGQRTGDFDHRLPPAWLAALAIGIGHTGGEEVATGRMTTEQAWNALEHSVMCILASDRRPARGQCRGVVDR